MRHTLLLFDIDGTLLRCHGMGLDAMRRAGGELFGEPFEFEGVEVAGRLDRLIYHDLAARNNVPDPHERHDDFRDRYVRTLTADLTEPGHKTVPTPGAVALIESLLPRVSAPGDIVLGMVTGNYREAARAKLAAVGLDLGRFTITAFGDEADTRPGLVELALSRYEAEHAADPDPSRVIVIGDTPHDVDCAKAHGCIAFAVATGVFTADELRAHGADMVVDDLADPTPLLAVIDR